MLQDDEPSHETDRLVWRTHFVVKPFRKLGLELVPVNLVRENIEGMLVVQLLLKGTEKACLCVGFWRSVHGKNCKVFNPILEILAIISQGKNQIFPIIMRAGRDLREDYLSSRHHPVQGPDRFPVALLPDAPAELSGFPREGKAEAVFRVKTDRKLRAEFSNSSHAEESHRQ